jgi:6-phosphogluconolactonase
VCEGRGETLKQVPQEKSMAPVVEILADLEALVDYAQALVIEKIQAAIAQHNRCTIALAGGSTPKPVYQALAKADLPWDKLHIFWGDERYVPLTHPDSNANMAKAAWLDQVPIPSEQIYPVPTGATDPATDAAAYEQTLQRVFATSADFPSFDLILLGLGDDAHTASLFPHTAVLAETQRWVSVGQKGDDPRITFTASLINQAQTVIFLVSGASKQAALSQVFAPSAADNAYPARLIRPQGQLYWVCDAAAGGGLIGDR